MYLVGTIQLPYHSGFSSLWEYIEALKSDSADFSGVLSGRCPICKRRNCLRLLPEYWRWAITLFPYRKELIPVVRLFCRKTHKTVSLLPLELSPYHPYTIPSMFWVVWLCVDGLSGRPPVGILRMLLDAVRDTNDVTESLVGFWVKLLLQGFHRAHPELRKTYDLSGISSGHGFRSRVLEVGGYLRGCRVRGPPELERDAMALLQETCTRTNRFLFGIPSQDRNGSGK